jgi:YD repeat-containing protein
LISQTSTRDGDVEPAGDHAHLDHRRRRRAAGVGGLSTTTAYRYDALGRLGSVTGGAAGTPSFVYDTASRLTSLNRPNAASDAVTYAPGSQLATKVTTRFSGLVARSDHRYDAAGLRDQYIDLDGTHDYTYDNLGQLTAATHPAASGLAEG